MPSKGYKTTAKAKTSDVFFLNWYILTLSVMSLTRVYPNANCKTLIRHMADFENLDGAQEMQSHC